VQLALTAAGFAGLVYWLMVHRLPPVFALGWLLSAGTIESLCRGILDAPGDALFVLTFLALAAGRIWFYLPLATLLLLAREGYAVYAFAVFGLTALARCGWQDSCGRWKMLPRIGWRDIDGYWKPVVLAALPGLVMLAWTVYLAIHFGQSPSTARNNPDAT